MHASPAFDDREAVTQNIPKILAAFLGGLLAALGGAVIYSNFQESRNPIQAVKLVRSEQPAPLAVQKQAAPSRATASPEPSARKAATPVQSADKIVPAVPSSIVQHRAVPAPASNASPGLGSQEKTSYAPPPQFTPVQQTTPQPQSAPVLDAKYAPSPEQQVATAMQAQSPPAVPLKTYPEPALSHPASTAITVQPGTTLAVHLSETLSSDRNRPGDTFRASLASPLVVNGYVIADAGATVLGRVVISHRAPLIGGRSDLSLTVTDISTADGRLTHVETGTCDVRGARSNLTNTAKMATGAAVGAVVGAVTGAAKGAGIASSALEEGHEGTSFMAGTRIAAFPAGSQIPVILARPFTATGTLPRR